MLKIDKKTKIGFGFSVVSAIALKEVNGWGGLQGAFASPVSGKGK